MIIKRDGSIAAGNALTPNNIWAGSAFEYLRGPAFLSFGIVCVGATAAATNNLMIGITVGAALVAEEYEAPGVVNAVRGVTYPQIAEAFLVQAAGTGGDRLVTTARNIDATNARVFSAVVQITPARGR